MSNRQESDPQREERWKQREAWKRELLQLEQVFLSKLKALENQAAVTFNPLQLSILKKSTAQARHFVGILQSLTFSSFGIRTTSGEKCIALLKMADELYFSQAASTELDLEASAVTDQKFTNFEALVLEVCKEVTPSKEDKLLQGLEAFTGALALLTCLALIPAAIVLSTYYPPALTIPLAIISDLSVILGITFCAVTAVENFTNCYYFFSGHAKGINQFAQDLKENHSTIAAARPSGPA